ncbi:MAG: riboflavin biosynthesis protein RibF [Planctomycetota bacterium]
MNPPTAITIGNFDGVHAGHAALVRRARTFAGDAGRVVAMAFDPHPAAVLRPGSEPPRLTTFDQRASLLREAGADEVERLDPASGLLDLPARDFIATVVRRWSPGLFVEGPDFHFGRGRDGNVSVLTDLGREFGFDIAVERPIEAALSDQTVVRASSTVIRRLLSHGRVADAWAVLGRPYRLSGEVQRGERRGRTIGFPTANVAAGTMLPGDGVYAALAIVGDRWWPAAVNVGARPTVEGTSRTVESHLIAAKTRDDEPAAIDGLPEYGWHVELRLVGWLRDQVRFPGLDALRAQLERDVERARRVVESRLSPLEIAQ